MICSLTLQLKFRKVEHLLFSPYGRNIFPPRLPPDPTRQLPVPENISREIYRTGSRDSNLS